ncbi:non-ribosomal peptide synthetase [Mucilaginibacter sp. OK098]|uniref:non-ribosomal peptide synthetase n=1 Tax=Mucilaginibacter sp. OK098 TaxID=1855297 RepID=UPI0009218A82|nr:non-ribosomal peptide synthetase [Mucilaginibacter sp. OK098]SHL87069.1 non-ribosomal peptide synthase domain TIGR01720/amino acid adenylation domain-containing protein [Mucilaginibacter sp. OK098]
MNKNTIEDIYALSPMQEGMLFHLLAHPDSEAYFEQVSCDLEGSLNLPAFKQAWQETVNQYPVFRTSFHWDGLDKPVQVVHKTAELPWEILDWGGFEGEQVNTKFEQLLRDDRRKGFNHEQAPLMRCVLVNTANNLWKFIWSHHHMLMDGWCTGIILSELFTRYQAIVNGKPVHFPTKPPFKNYISWLGKQDMKKAKDFWDSGLAGFDTPTLLGIGDAVLTDKNHGGHGYAEYAYNFSPQLSNKLFEWTKQIGITTNVLIQGVWSILLSKYSGENEVVFGATVSGRPPELQNVESIVGLFINSLPVRVNISSGIDIIRWLKDLQVESNERNEFTYTPLVDIKKSSGISGDMPLFRSLLVFENYPFDATNQQGLYGLEIKNVKSFEETNYPLTLMIIPRDGLLKFQLNYFKDCFGLKEIERLFCQLEIAVNFILDNPSESPAKVSLLSSAERENVLVKFNDTSAPLPSGQTILDLINENVIKSPHNVAVYSETGSISYAELNNRADAIKNTLLFYGVKRGDKVAILQERNTNLIVSILAIMKAGAAFLPIDVSLPHNRIHSLISEADVKVLISANADLFPKNSNEQLTIIHPDFAHNTVAGNRVNDGPQPDDTAYVIYTSGSTGKPKGVEISHLSLLNYIIWANDYYFTNNPHGGDFPLFTSPAFDLTLSSIFIPLSKGKTISVYGDKEVGIIMEEIFGPQGTLDSVKLTPSHITLLKDIPEGNDKLLTLITGGEALKEEHVKIINDKWPGITIYNEYGPTEATIGCTATAISAGNINAGKPVANTSIYILDKALMPVPIGIKGGIYIGGACLAKGYLGQPEQTVLKFINSPFANGEIIYQTGDTGCWLEDGNIQYFGREDDQVKIRGYRIEPGEIENQLVKYPGVIHAAVIPVKNHSGEYSLVAFIEVTAPDVFELESLKETLAKQLPAYMLPVQYRVIDSFPLTPNGKTNKKALLNNFDAGPQLKTTYHAPTNPIEEIITAIWEEILKIEKPGIFDNFFEAGGHSLNATQITSRIRSIFKVDLGVKDIMENQTIEHLVVLIAKLKLKGSGEGMQPVIHVTREEGAQLSFAQQRLWFLDRLEGASATYNIPEAIKIEGKLDINILQNVFTEIISRHDILRTNFHDVDGKAYQLVKELQPFNISIVASETNGPEVLEKLIADEAIKPFDLERDALIRAILFTIADDSYVLSVTMHHIVSDGWSSGIFIRELVSLYEAFILDKPSPLAALTVQYSDFAYWQRSLKNKGVFGEQLAYWKNKLSGAPFILDLPTDKPRPSVRTENGDTYRFSLSPQLSDKLKSLSKKSGATLFMTLLSAYSILLSRYSRQRKILIGSSIANRNRLETEALIGFFINVVVYRVDLENTDTFLSLIDQVRQLAFEAYAHQDVPFDQLIDEIQPERDLSHSPVFQVAFDMQNMPMPALEISGLKISPMEVKRSIAKYDLSLSMEETADGLVGGMEYNTDLFHHSTIAQMVRHFQVLLEGIVENPKQNLRQLSLISKDEFRKIVFEWNNTDMSLPEDKTVLAVVKGVANENPDKIAFEYDGLLLTYGELEIESENFARRLLAMNLVSGDRVGVIATRSIRTLSAILGVMKAGGVYIPVDPEYPRERISYMLKDSGAALLIGEGNIIQEFDLPFIDTKEAEVFAQPVGITTNLLTHIKPGALAYIIYTSGSTGNPKGVMIRHRGLLNLSLEQIKAFRVNKQSRTLQFASLSFDASISEMFVSLCAGSTLVMAPKAKMLPGPDLISLLEAAAITHVTLPPSILEVLPYTELPVLSTLVVAGEACPRKTAETWGKNRYFINAYGPTEYTVCSTLTPYTPGEGPLHIGRPIGNTVAYILDEDFVPLPPGIPGELFIGGVGVAAGYVNLPELTAARFITDPFSKKQGSQMYRTGDLAKFLPDGNICFLGRIDRQLKLRGFRIEPEEIETVLKQHPSVSQSVIQVQNDESGHQRLNAFVTLKDVLQPDNSPQHEWSAGPMELWPSVAEFYVYDEFLYYAMTHDERRNDAYKKAIIAEVPGKIVVEIGTGKDAILSRFCAEAGAAKIYAIELNENTAKLAKEAVERAGYADRITIIHGDASKVILPELADVCVSEIVGAIGGSEGSAVIINNSRRLLKEGGKMIPERSNTMMAAVSLPDVINENPGFNKVPGHYTKEIFDQVGYPFDLRLCIKKFPNDHLLSSKDIFEDLDYTKPIDPETSHTFRFEILKKGRMDGILVWLNLHTTTGVIIDILEHEYCWLPVFLPIFCPGAEVEAGDYITGICTRTLCENGLNPDFLLEGTLVRMNGIEINFSYNSWHYKQVYKENPFYQKLFANNKFGLLPPSVNEDLPGLEAFLQDKLPAYLLPNSIIVLDEIPLTINGKIDQQALKEYTKASKRVLNEYTAPHTEKEKILALIWQNVLGIENVGIHHNFFKLGGDSILSIQIVSRARSAGLEFTPRDLFENQTIAQLATVARIKTKTTAEQGLVVGNMPLSPIQSWFFEQDFIHPHHFNQAVLLETNEQQQPEIIRQAITKLVLHHDALRMRFCKQEINGEWTQEMMPEIKDDIFNFYNLDLVPIEEKETKFLETANSIQSGLNIYDGVVFKAVFFRMGDDIPSRLLLVAHHLVIDGVSWRILLEDFLHLTHEQASAKLPEKSHSFKKWINALSAYSKTGLSASEIAYWKKISKMPVSLIPLDHQQPINVSSVMSPGITTVYLNGDKTDALLKKVPAAYRTQVQEVLLAAFILSLNQWSGNRTAIIELEGHGREDLFEEIDISRTVGWFTAAYPAVFSLPENCEPGETLQVIKEQYREIPGKGIGYGLLKYLSDDKGDFGMLHAPEIVFNYLGQGDSVITGNNNWKFSDADCGFEQSPGNHRTHLLGVNLIVLNGQLKIGIGYDKNKHRESTISKLAGYFISNLNILIDHCLQPGTGGFSPADFPLSNLGKSGMNTLAAQIKDAGYPLVQVADIYKLSPLQPGLLFQSLLNPSSVSYREQLSVILKGKLNPALFKKAWQLVIDKYDILRTAFFWEGIDTPVQVVLSETKLTWNEDTWNCENDAEGKVAIEQFLEDDLNQSFSFSKAPLMRLTLANIHDDQWFFCWTHHHILMDGWCLPIIIREVFDNYEALIADRDLQVVPVTPYANFIKWLGKQDEGAAKEWWANYLTGFHHPTPLGIDQHQSSGRAGKMQDCATELGAELENRLKQFAQNTGVTLNILIHAAWSLLLSKYAGTDDVVFGAVVSGRPPELEGVEKMVGLFINSVPVRISVNNDSKLDEWLQNIQLKQLERDNYSYTSLTKIREYSGMDGNQQLFESLIIFENYPVDKSVDDGIKGLTISSAKFSEQTHYPVTLMVVPGEGLSFRISYDSSKFEKETINRVLRHLLNILNGFSADADQTLGEISLIGEEETAFVLNTFNAQAPVVSHVKLVLEEFNKQVLVHPEATALLFEGENYSYGEINLRANQLANLLLNCGLKPGGLAALCLDRSPEMIISLLAILKTGAAYLPLDPKFPVDRLHYMLDNSGAAMLLTEEKYKNMWQGEKVQMLVIEEIKPVLTKEKADEPNITIKPNDLAYIIYTSGSTGKPKGVQISHGALGNFLASMKIQPGISSQDILLAVTTISFDIAGLEIFLPLTSGATVALLSEEVSADPEKLTGCMNQVKPTIMQATPATWQMLLNNGWNGSGILKVLCGGEALPNELAAELVRCNKSLWNMYGPTETTIWSAVLNIDPQQHLSSNGYALIGGPIANTAFYILDEARKPVPAGVAGELYIGGDGVAKGYLGLPELTEEKFIPDPFSKQQESRIYRTGDLAKWASDGKISFLGRIDQQVKIRGFRIETGEVESVIKEIAGINDAVVTAGKDHLDNDCLLAFIIAENGESISAAAIREVLLTRLPVYMIPSAFIALDKFPLTPNGKTDRKALKNNYKGQVLIADENYVAPVNQLQEKIHEIWAEVLGIPQISIKDNFFMLGGHSLLATQCISRVRTGFELEVPLKMLFDHPDIESFAIAMQQFISEAEQAQTVSDDDNEVFEF